MLIESVESYLNTVIDPKMNENISMERDVVGVVLTFVQNLNL